MKLHWNWWIGSIEVRYGLNSNGVIILLFSYSLLMGDIFIPKSELLKNYSQRWTSIGVSGTIQVLGRELVRWL